MLRAINSKLKHGGRHVFYVITARQDLTKAEHARIAARDGNEYLFADAEYDDLMETAGFESVDMTDVTDGYLETLIAWTHAWESDSDSFIDLIGKDDFELRMKRRQQDVTNVEEGLVKRYRVAGVKPRSSV